MQDDVKVKVPNKTPKILNPSNRVVNWDGVLKFGGKLEGDHAMHFFRLDRKIYRMKFDMEMFIGR
jgi:hypothetical protein